MFQKFAFHSLLVVVFSLTASQSFASARDAMVDLRTTADIQIPNIRTKMNYAQVYGPVADYGLARSFLSLLEAVRDLADTFVSVADGQTPGVAPGIACGTAKEALQESIRSARHSQNAKVLNQLRTMESSVSDICPALVPDRLLGSYWRLLN